MSTHAVLVTMSGYPVVPSNFMPDNGLAQLAACLVAEGHDVTILDFNTPEMTDRLFPKDLRQKVSPLVRTKLERPLDPDEASKLADLERELDAHRDATFDALGVELARTLRELGAGFVGFKLWNGDGFSGSERMARQVKNQWPDLPVLGGGSHADFFAEYLPTIDSAFDYFGIQEGEATIIEFARYASGEVSIDSVPNLVWRTRLGPQRTATDRIDDLDGLPAPLYDPAIYPAIHDAGKLRAGVVEETRGCPHHCAFCNHPLKAGHKLRVRKPEHVVDLMADMRSSHGISAFKLGGSYTPTGYLKKLANCLIDRNLGVTFCGYGRISDARRADFEHYYRAGCRSLFFGVESGSQMLLDEAIDKGYQTEHAEIVLKAAKAAGIYTIASLVYPNPGETADSRQATLRLLERVKPDGVPVHFPLLLPGSTWWTSPQKFGFDVPDRERFLSCMLRYKARLLFPPQFWPEIPYRIDGREFAEFAHMTAELTRDIDALGCTTLISDETALLGLHSGLGIREFRDEFRTAVALGDADAQQTLVDRVNRNLLAAQQTPEPPPRAQRGVHA